MCYHPFLRIKHTKNKTRPNFLISKREKTKRIENVSMEPHIDGFISHAMLNITLVTCCFLFMFTIKRSKASIKRFLSHRYVNLVTFFKLGP